MNNFEKKALLNSAQLEKNTQQFIAASVDIASALQKLGYNTGYGYKNIKLTDALLTRTFPILDDSAELAKPSQLTLGFPAGFKIYKKGNYYATDYNVSTTAPTGKTYYVDPVNGLETNDGLAFATALKSISAAIAKSDVVVIQLKDGIYKRAQIDNAITGLLIQKTLTIKGETPFGAKLIPADNLSWVKTGGYTNVYNATRTSTNFVVDCANVDSNGIPIKLTLVASIALVDSTPNSYYKDGSNVFYVHTYNDRTPDSDISVLFNTVGIVRFYPTVNGSKLHLENIMTIGGNSVEATCFYGADGKNNLMFTAKNCKFTHTDVGSGVVQVSGLNSIMQNVLACGKVDTDGFNYHTNSSQIGWSIEINCIGRNNGDGSSDQGSTIHDARQIIRLNCAYWGNAVQGIADINDGTVSWNVGCISAENVGTKDIEALLGSTLICEGCIIPDNTRLGGEGTLINNNPRPDVVKTGNNPSVYLYS